MSRDVRFYQLAHLACLRIEDGHDPQRVIQEAIVRAVNPGSQLPECFDLLTTMQREVVLLLYGSGWTKKNTMAKILGWPLNNLGHLLLRMQRTGLLERHPATIGVYRLTNGHHQVARRQPWQGSPIANEKRLDWIAEQGAVTAATLAANDGITRAAARDWLQRQVRLSRLAWDGHGAYAPFTHPTAVA